MKKVKSQSGMVTIIPEYDKKRLDNLKLNESRMKARGCGTLASKILLSNLESTRNRIVVEEDTTSEEVSLKDMLDEDEDYQPDHPQECEVDELYIVPNPEPVGKDIISRTKGKRLALKQNVPMAEFAQARNKKHSIRQQKKPVQAPRNIQEHPRVHPAETCQKKALQQLHLHQVPSQHNSELQRPIQQQNTQEILERKKMLQEQQVGSKRLLRDQYCSPGSLDMFRKVRQKQQGVRHPSNVELLPTTAVQDEARERMPSLVTQDQYVHGLPSSSTLPEVSVENQNEANESMLNPTTQDQSVQGTSRCTNQDNTQKVAEKKKHRGPTLMVKVHQRTLQERPQIFLNEKGQPIGPPSAVTELAGFLGTIAKDPQLAPLHILDWRCMPTKDIIWNYVKEKIKIEEKGRKYVLETVNDDWRVYKSRLKRKHYKLYETDEERWNNRPITVPDNQFRELLDYWDSIVGKEISCVNATNRQKHEDVHTMGSRSIARLRYELEKNTEKELPSDSVVYKLSRKRNPTHIYKTNGCKTKENIDKMNDIQLQIERGEKEKNVDPYSEVIMKEHNGRAFMQGRGLKTPTLKDKKKKGGYIVDEEFYQNLKAEWEEEIVPTLVSKILSQLQAANPEMNLMLPGFTSALQNPDQRVGEKSLDENVESFHSPQDDDAS